MPQSKLCKVTVASLVGLGSLVLTFVYRRRLSNFLWYLRSKSILKKEKQVYIICKHHQWEEIADAFCRNTKAINAVGFDCEWIQLEGKRRPVALMQLATYTGMCALFRLNYLKDNIPQSLKEILDDDKIAKVGVTPNLDAQYLMQDHNILVNGWVDLRHLAVQNTRKNSSRNGQVQEKFSLKALAMKYLEKNLNKDWRVRGGNWEANKLAKIQVNYAAEDALVGIHVLLCMVKDLNRPWSPWPPFRLKDWEVLTSKAVKEVCSPVTEVKFAERSRVDGSFSVKKRDGTTHPPAKPLKELRMSYSTRKSPLYHNSQLWAPDGEPLCTCDPKKAIWYVEKGLGKLISETPLVVKLKFEPAGRPNKEGVDGQFYLEERYNICVVCGKDESYIRKNIIPHEYRKYFPEILKSHQSHDVVLLCTICHQSSNMRDTALRYTLAKEFDAPIGCETDVKLRIDGKLKAIRSAGGALRKSRRKLPPARIEHLEKILREFFHVETLTEEHINMASELDTQIMNEDYIPHGYKVILHYRSVGLIKLEQRWRQWFLDSMKPKYLPEKWSASHNHKKLRIKMSRHPQNAKIRDDYKMALVGTEGEIDVPYVPRENGKDESSFYGMNSDEELFSKENTPEQSTPHMTAK